MRESRRGLFVAELLAEELLAAFAAGYHKDPEQDKDGGGYFGECELVLTIMTASIEAMTGMP